jgi:vesicle-fusing ATPase
LHLSNLHNDEGVDPLSVPTLLIGLTNKPSLIDPALMRPGRFEVKVEVPKPKTVEQRASILKVHMESMMKSGRVLVRDAPIGTASWRLSRQIDQNKLASYDELVDLIAVECDGMSGASLAGVARAAASRALERAVSDFAGHVADVSHGDVEMQSSINDCLVTQEDFEKAGRSSECAVNDTSVCT